jgi:signal transduction histidine kinase/ligand-binding sensor domain-containing protein
LRALLCRREIRQSVRARTITLVLLLILLSGSLLPAHAEIQPITLGTVTEARMSSHPVTLPVIDGEDIRFSHLSTKAGLSQTRVAQIVQDDDGFLWFGTQYGLDRYDGYNFKVFVHDPTRESSLNCAFVYSLFKDRDGTLWVGCDNDVDRFDKMSETFTHYRIAREGSEGLPVTVWGISQDHTGALWLSTGSGLYRLDPTTGRMAHYGHDPMNSSSLSSNDVKFTGEDSGHRFWVTDGDNLEEFDRGQDKVLLRVQLTGLTELGQRGAMGNLSFYEDHLGVFWIIYTTAGYGSGLAVFERATNRLTRYSIHDQKSGRELSGGVMAAVEDLHKTLWLATKSDGLLRFDRERGIFIRYRNHPDDLESLAEDRLISLCADREGNVWAGLHATSPDFFGSTPRSFTPLLRRPSNPHSFGENFVNAIYEDHQGVLWIGTTGALIRIDRKSGQYRSYPPPGPGLDNDIVAITEDRAGVLWVGSMGAGLGRFDQRTGRFKTYRHHASDPSSLSDDAVSRVFVDQSGTMWVTTWNGLDRFDPVTERFVVYKRDKESQTEQYYNITQDQAGTLWIGGIMGLTRFDPNSGRFILYGHKPGDPGSLSDNLIDNVYVDHLGTVWAATQNGLNQLDAKSGTFTKYYAADGLPINALSCILEDGSGKLWISTTRGLSRFDPLTKTFKNYSTADGLPGDDLTGWDACFKGSRGEMFFGGFSGGIAFYPDTVKDTSYIPPVVLTDFQLSGNPVEIGPQSLLKKSITYTNDLTLSHEKNVFSLTFSALSYLNPAENRYRYMLDGLDHHWTEVGSDHRLATYTTLPPNTYTFLVQGATSRGAWSEPGVKLSIRVLPPWWATLWFRSLCVAAFLALLWGLYQIRLRQIAHEFDVRLEERVSERTRIARELHDSLLQGFQGLMFRLQAVRNKLPGRPSEAMETLDIALKSGDKAILEGRDTVSDLRLSVVGDSDIAQALTAMGEELAAQSDNGAAPCVRVLVEGNQREFDPVLRDEIYRIAREALRNAFRHAKAQKIEAEITYGASEFLLRVRDDGTGIDQETSNRGGRAGHWGLLGMRERAKSFGGRLEVWSEHGAGTEIALTVPASIAYGRSEAHHKLWFL